MVRRTKDQRKKDKGQKVILYPLMIRIWHWIHALAILLLVLTGIQLRFPDWIGWFGTFRNSVNIHNNCGFIVVFDYMLWLAL
jgi:thiosulfate reductase cytochrome b subunit